MEYIHVLQLWYDFFFGLFGLLGLPYGIAHTSSSEHVVLQYKDSLSKDSAISRAFNISYRLSSHIFGPRLLSWRAFGWGLLLSTVVFIVAYTGAVLTTPGMLYGLRDLFFLWDNPMLPFQAHFLTIVSTLSLTVTGLMLEFIYVVKSRWLLRFINIKMSGFITVLLVILDVCTTYIVLIVITPVFLLVFGMTTQMIVKPLLDPRNCSLPARIAGVAVS